MDLNRCLGGVKLWRAIQHAQDVNLMHLLQYDVDRCWPHTSRRGAETKRTELSKLDWVDGLSRASNLSAYGNPTRQ
jgi:hypothetical protein